jgi:class 3 adenylate cyclase
MMDFLLDAASEILDERELGVSPASRPGPAEKRSAYVLFTDIVDSTAHLTRLGDERWSEVLRRHDAVSRAAVERHGGTLVRTTGDGALALFGDAAAGIACARSILSRVRPLGIEARAGLHSGDYLSTGSDICGLAVHVAARVAGCARAGEVRFSEAVRDAIRDPTPAFADCGVELLKGIPGEWRLYATRDL